MSNMGDRHHSGLYFDDGNVMIFPRDHMHAPFKVHRSLLKRHSNVLELAIIASNREIDGCPAVILDEVSADDVAHMLYSIYDNRRYSQAVQLPYDTVVSLLRMGTRYEMGYLLDEAQSRLRACYPDTLSGYDKLQEHDSSLRRIRWSPDQDYQVARVAHEYDLADVLPIALYECCALPPHDLLQHMKKLDTGHVLSASSAEARDAVFAKCYEGRSSLVEQRAADALCFLTPGPPIISPQCGARRDRCAQAWRTMKEFSQTLRMNVGNPRALDNLDDFIDTSVADKACRDCVSHWKKSV